MLSLLAFKIIAALVIMIITILAGIWPFLRKKTDKNTFDFPQAESFAGGIFLGAGLLHMLPNSAAAFIQAGYQYPYAFLLAASMFLLLLLLEHISVSMQRHAHQLIPSIVLLTVLMLSIHSLLEGTAVGIAERFATMIIIFIAIIAHKGAASFALSTNLNKSNLKFAVRFFAFLFFALMTPLGIFLGDWVALGSHHSELLMPIFSALAAGTFLYIGTLHGLERASLIKHCCNMREFFFMIAGFLIMALVAIWV